MISMQPIKTEINNGTLSGVRAMPQKDVTSDSSSMFAMSRMAYTGIVTSQQNNQKKWMGNRDASHVTTNRRVNGMAIGSLNAKGTPMSFTTTADNNTARQALHRVRSGGAVAPAKANRHYGEGHVFY